MLKNFLVVLLVKRRYNAFMSEEIIVKEIGMLLAQGYSESEIIALLIGRGVAKEQALHLLKSIYHEWQHTSRALAHKVEDLVSYHNFMRHQLLQTALRETANNASKSEVSSLLRTALAILDSLATLNKIVAPDSAGAATLTVTFVPKGSNADGNIGSGSGMDQVDSSENSSGSNAGSINGAC